MSVLKALVGVEPGRHTRRSGEVVLLATKRVVAEWSCMLHYVDMYRWNCRDIYIGYAAMDVTFYGKIRGERHREL